MTIERGRIWGEPLELPDGAPTAGSDAELAALVHAAVAQGRPPIVGVGPGDVARTLGVDGMRPPGHRVGFPFDLGYVSLDGADELPFVAHVVVRRTLWRGRFAAVMNAAWVGQWYLGPRAHPNDGRLDITEGRLSGRQRLLARSRLASGSHLPHPDLGIVRADAWTGRFDRPTPVVVDGVAVGRAVVVAVRVVPDRFTLIA
ncbi:MAG: hypothetical protein ACFCVK_21920 [Acidimicrobiales bacterium]